jgi:hypothetical protein
MANEFYNRGATFNPDELADGDALEAEFDAVVRGFDTINTAIDTDRAGYPTQTFHVAPATETTHAPQKAQLDAHTNSTGGVHGAASGNIPGNLMMRDSNGDVAARTFVGDCYGNANTATNATQHINATGGVHGAASENIPGKLMMRDSNGDVAARTFVGNFAVYGSNVGMYNGNADGVGFYGNNLKLSSWFGVGFAPAITGSPVPYGEYSHWFNTRNGDAGMRGTLTQNSDLRLKENILSIPDALTKVCSLRGITYDRKDGGGRSTGVIAQEVQAVLPEAVAMADDDQGTLSVAYGNLVGLLIESIKELKAEVDQLKVAISAP